MRCKISLSLILVMLVSGLIFIQVNAQNTPTLREVFNAPSCIVSCWLGIQPNVTTKSQLEALLLQHGISYTVTQIDQFLSTYDWIPSGLPYIDTRSAMYGANVWVANGIVAEINLPVDIPLQQIVQEYGAPTIANVSTDGRDTTIVYPSFGLYFEASSLYDSQYVSNVRVEGNGDLVTYFAGVPSNIKDCSLYSESGCILATATPTPILFVTNTPNAQNLLSVLKPAGCKTTCFMGIQPGVTTQQEVKAIFARRNIHYTINAAANSDEPNSIYEWEMPTTGLNFTNDNGNTLGAFITFSNGIVRQLVVGLSIPVSTIIAAFGQPDLFTSADGAFYMLYPQQGVIFQPTTPNLAYSTAFFLVRSDLMNEYLTDSYFQPVKNCTEFTELCVVKTATPTIKPIAGDATSTLTTTH